MESILNRTRNMSDFIGEWASVSQDSMHITVGTDQSVPEMGSIMGMNPANERLQFLMITLLLNSIT